MPPVHRASPRGSDATAGAGTVGPLSPLVRRMTPPPNLIASAKAPPRLWATHAALMVVQVAFASQAVEGKIVMLPRVEGGEEISPFAVAMVRMVGAAVVFQAFARATGLLKRVSGRDHLWLAVLSVLGIALNQALFLIGLRMTSPMSAALLGITIPVLTAALAVVFREEKASGRTAVGLAVACAGVVWLVAGKGGSASVDRGALIIACNCLSYSAYIVLSRSIIRRIGAFTVVTWLFTWAALLFAPFGAAPLLSGVVEWTPRGWGFISYIVLFPTVVAYIANAWALGRSNASLVTVYIYVQPLITAVLAWVQLGHSVSPRIVIAAALIVVGVAIVSSRVRSPA